MKRFFAIFACVAIIGLVVGAIAYGLASDGPTAYSVRGADVSQQSVDEELAALADSDALSAAIQQSGGTPLSAVEGSITAQTSAGWVGLRVAQTVAAQAVERRGLEATKADTTRGAQLAAESVGGAEIYSTLPDWFRQRLADRWTNVAVLEREVLADPSPELQAAAAELCPSGRYVSHILVDTEAQAAAIKQAIDRGGDFATVATSSSKDGSAKDGGQLGCLDGQNFVEPFATVAANQPIGVVSDPFQTEFGYHVILVTDQPAAADVQQIALESVLGRARGTAVSVDPRYGVWDRRNGQVVPPSLPGATPTLPAGSAPASSSGG
ncbi:MAG: peptidylprolyl isomerase [Acidimicrobiia bacterium]|nr:peptidylprolyl isomerase [Acidimicrobiia bacterium]